MLKISIDVQSGIDGFLSKVVANPNNRHLFLHGILLNLMGERISLHALDKCDNPEFVLQKEKLQNFLDRLSIKGVTTKSNFCFDTMSFEQSNKHGVPTFTTAMPQNTHIESIKNLGHRLNPDYMHYTKSGLLDSFAIPDDEFIHCLIGDHWFRCKTNILSALKSVIARESFESAANLCTQDALDILNLINFELEKLPTISALKRYEIGDSPYKTIMDSFERAAMSNKEAKKKKNSEENRLLSLQRLEAHQIRMCMFAVQYIAMYLDKHSDGTPPRLCSQFGIKELNMKSKAGILNLVEFLEDVNKPILSKPNMNGSTEFYKSIIKSSPYGVSTSSPVLNKRYDGRFELYVKSDPDTLLFIKDRIMNSDRYFLRVGKRSLGKLIGEPGIMPQHKFDSIIDDVNHAQTA
jgi:hypothetical protein